MPRNARIKLSGNYFHIMVQGINKEYIFEENKSKEKYVEILKNIVKNLDIEILAYCIMSNHVHILIKVEKIEEMSKFMHDVNSAYGKYYNYINDRVGFVFRNRYKTQPILNEEHLKSCVVYIHKNPVKAGMVKQEKDYKYSSYNEYLHDKKIITSNSEKILFGDVAIDNYKKIFLNMHKNNFEKYIIEAEEDKNYNKIIEEYRRKNTNEKIIIINLKNEYKMSERHIATLLSTTRHKIRKVLNES